MSRNLCLLVMILPFQHVIVTTTGTIFILVLFVATLLLNIVALRVVQKYRERYE